MVEQNDSNGKGAAVVPYLEQVFGDDGIFPRAGYAPRPGQVALAYAVNRSIREGAPVLAEAGTGVGKSFGYLVPAIWHVTEGAAALLATRPDPEEDDDGEAADTTPRALIVTAGITLQEQLIGKDIPTLQRLLPWRFTAALAKGRSNYVCLDRADDAQAERASVLGFIGTEQEEEREQWTAIDAWLERTETGDFSELPFEPDGPLKHRLTIASDDCTGKHCPRFKDCYSEAARRRVGKAQIIVANYHILFAHMNLMREFGRGILPPFDIVVFDEAHAAPSIAREFFGFLLSHSKVRHAARFLVPAKRPNPNKAPLPPLDPELHAAILAYGESVFDDLDTLRRGPTYKARLRAPFEPEHYPALDSALAETSKVYQRAIDGLNLDKGRKAELSRAQRRLAYLRLYLGATFRCVDYPGEELVYSLEEERGRTVIFGRRLHPGPVLREELFASPLLRTVVATSATLATGPGSEGFAFALAELGATDARTLTVATPFDYPRQAMLCVPSDLHDPKAPNAAEEAARWVVRCVEAAHGRTLGLFTSRRALTIAAEAVRGALWQRYQILVQGEAPRTRLIDAFKADVSSVLLGTRSFWAGVDVPGPALSLVVIDKMPFDTPDDPILDALQAKIGRRTFSEWSVPRAAIELRQGVGRLIRTTADRGVVVLLDRRLADTAWGRGILDALPPMYRSRQFEKVGRLLAPRPPQGVPDVG